MARSGVRRVRVPEGSSGCPVRGDLADHRSTAPGRAGDVRGRYYTTRDARLVPPARHRIPVLVAGEGPRMVRLAARHADAWNTAWYGAPDERLSRQLAALRGALESEGRDPATIMRTVG